MLNAGGGGGHILFNYYALSAGLHSMLRSSGHARNPRKCNFGYLMKWVGGVVVWVGGVVVRIPNSHAGGRGFDSHIPQS